MSSRVRWASVTIGFLFPRFSLTTFSINRLQLLRSVAVILRSHPTLSRSQLTQFCHRILGLPHFLLLSTFYASDPSGSLSFFHLSHKTGPLQPTPHQCLLKMLLPSSTFLQAFPPAVSLLGICMYFVYFTVILRSFRQCIVLII